MAVVGVTPTVAWRLTGMPDLRSSAVSWAATYSGGSPARRPSARVPSFSERAERGPQSSVMPGFHELTARAASK